MRDAVIISDIHLGADVCQAKRLIHFLEAVLDGEILTRSLILNGDVFDSIDFRRLKKNHWKVLSLIRKLSDKIDIVWLNGNHDGPSEIVSHLIGVRVQDEMVLESGGKKILILHGHIFDQFLDTHPIISSVADWMYRLLQKIDRSHTIAKQAKKSSKTFLRCTQKIEAKSTEYARDLDCDAVCCGHTHLAIVNRSKPVAYYNSGCWTEKPCHYLTIENGVIDLHSYTADVHEGEEELYSTELAIVSEKAVFLAD